VIILRISSKSCYAIAALAEMAAEKENTPIAVATLAQRLAISKIYLEQVFSALKRGGLLVSTKGAQGGYTLREAPEKITLYDILSPIEQGLFENAEKSLENLPQQPAAIINKLIFEPLDKAVEKNLKSVTLAELAAELKNDGDMYYI
jgi:Rrf2 family protein